MAEQAEEPRVEEISRAVTDLDLNNPHPSNGSTPDKAGKTIQYTKDDLLEIGRTTHQEHAEQTTVAQLERSGAPSPAGVNTPPYLDSPAPPPPTPVTPQTGDAQGTNGELNGIENGVVATGENGAVATGGKKKKKKSSGANKKPNPTGYEEFYADPPITPEESIVESDLYAPEREFHERMQTCIQRYRARRKLDEFKANIFSKYLILGGVEATGKAFTGGALDKETLAAATAEEIAAVQATDYIRSGVKNAKYYDPDEAEKWVVDFEGIAKGFFSRIVPFRIGADTVDEIKLASSVIRNFLNYVLQHNVCPEYIEEVMAARRICDLAERDLIAIKNIRTKLPGEFNVAASSICGGCYQGQYISSQIWESDIKDEDDCVTIEAGFSDSQGTRIFQAGIAFKGTDPMFVKAKNDGAYIVSTKVMAYEIVEIERATPEFVSKVLDIPDHKGATGKIKPLGVMKVKAWEGPQLEPEDFSDDEGPEGPIDDGLIESFWLEDDILCLLHSGLKLELTVHELNIGIKFFDQIMGLYCSFHTFLDNEKLHGWKEPAPNTRPPPTEEDPDVEERAADAEMQGELNDADKELGKKK